METEKYLSLMLSDDLTGMGLTLWDGTKEGGIYLFSERYYKEEWAPSEIDKLVGIIKESNIKEIKITNGAGGWFIDYLSGVQNSQVAYLKSKLETKLPNCKIVVGGDERIIRICEKRAEPERKRLAEEDYIRRAYWKLKSDD